MKKIFPNISFLALLFCLPTTFIFSQNPSSPIAFGRDTFVVSSNSPNATKWLNNNPLKAKTLQNLPSPSNPGYYADGIATVTFVDAGMIDNCGHGVRTRTYTVTSQGKSPTAVMRYVTENRSAYTVTFPNDTAFVITKGMSIANWNGQFSTLGVPQIKNLIDGSLVGVEYNDSVKFDYPKKQMLISRTWKALNWCQPLDLNPDNGDLRKTGVNCTPQKNTYTCINVLAADKQTSVFSDKATAYQQMQAVADKENCYQYDTDGYMERTQLVSVIDTFPPTITASNLVIESFNNDCKVQLTIGMPTVSDYTGLVNVEYILTNVKTQKILSKGSTFPATIVISEADYGDCIVKYIAKDALLNVANIEQTITVKDVKKPKVVCMHGLSFDATSSNGIIVKAASINNGSTDNCGGVEFFVQIPAPGAGADITKIMIDTSINGFVNRKTNPSKLAKNANFTCTGSETIALWAKDKYSNWDYCETYVEVQNNNGISNIKPCIWDPLGLQVQAVLKKENKTLVSGIVKLFATGFPNPLLQNHTPTIPPSYYMSFGSTVTASASNKLYPKNGVSTADLVVVSKHILGNELIKSKYKLVAADVNRSGTVTTADLVIIRKLILGYLDSFPNNSSWLFFSDTTLNEVAEVKNIQKDTILNFTAVKIGDLNDSAKGMAAGESTGRNESETAYFDLDEKNFTTGEEIIFSPKNPDIDGYQTTIFYDKKTMQLIDIQENSDNFAVKENGTILASEVFFNKEKRNPSALRFKALQAGKLSQSIRFCDAEIPSETYQNETTKSLKLRFNNLEKSNVELFQNQPNPFLNETKITFFSEKKTNATFTVFDLNNRLIHTESMLCEKGENQILFQNNQLTQGVYRYQIEVEDVVRSLKMIKL